VTRGSKFIYEFGRNSTVYCFVASGHFKSPVISSTIKSPENAYIYACFGAFSLLFYN